MGLNTHQYKSIPMEYVINLITHQSINWLIILSLLIIPKVYSSPMDTIDFVNDSPNQFNRHPKDATGFNRSLASSSSNSHHHQQYFRVRPRSNVEVIEGSSISLQCQVGNQAGAVQWAKDGFVLGFDRSIPGYPRYSMEGNPIKGEHNLQIENASIDDDGEYQCQVGPASNNKAIRANSRLTVLLKPKKIEIIGHSNGSAVEVREGEKVTLTCLVYGGKPSAKIKWFRRETELNSTSLPNQSVLTVTSSTNDGVSSSNGGGDSITTTRSELSLKLNAEDNGVTYTCSASHPALSSPLRSTVSMSVLYPPSAPEISGYHTGDIIRKGDTLKLRCRSRGGNPLAQLIWYKNDEPIDFSFDSHSNRESINEYTFEVDSDDNNAKFTCEAKTPISSNPMTTSVTLSVQFAPSSVTIVGLSEAKAGDNVTLICKTEPSNPPAELNWSIDGRTIKTENSHKSQSKGGGYITTTNITVPILSTERSVKTFSCFAINRALDTTVTATHALNILYSPYKPSIIGYDESTPLRAGSVKRLTCESQGGNPLADLKWFKGKDEITSGFTISSKINGISSELTLIVKDSDNGATYRCEASNSATIKPLEASVKLTVFFAPSKVKIKSRPGRIKAGTEVDLICETESSNPASEVVWWRNGQLLPGNVKKPIDSSFGGKSSKSILNINVTSSDDGTIFTCQAENHLLDQKVHDSITLNVQFKPEFGSESMVSFELVEGNEASINLTARGNPANIKYKWHRISGNNGLDSTRFITEGPVFNITSVLRQDSGSYLIEATNSQGTTKLPFTLNVKYAATITQKSDLALVDIGKTAYLECTVDANPITKDLIKWQRKPNYVEDSLESFTTLPTFDSDSVTMSDNERFKITILDNRSFLSVFNVSESDSGAYECLASNGIGSPDSATTNLIVKHQPRILMAPILSKSASDNGSKGRLVCRAQGAPNITFQWFREGAIISEKMTNNKYTVEPIEQPNLITYQSTLVINDVTNKDYGPYECIARNELGLNRLSIHFNRTSPPDPPLTLKIVNRTTSSITLRWIPGFDGGLSQSFRLRYQKIDTKSSDDSNTVISSSTSSPSDNSLSSLSSTTSSVVSSEPAQYSDVHPSNTTIFTIKGLTDNSEYSFNVMAYNDLGESKYNMDNIRGKTLQETPVSETERISQVFSGQSGDVPRLIIIAVSVLGSTLLLLNVVLVICFVRKRRKKRLEEETDGSSTNKPATIEMYAPASGSGGSYTNGPNETSLSASDEEKHSEGAYSGQTDYVMEINSGIPMNGNQQSIHPNIHSYMHGNIHQSLTTYLIDDPLENVKNYYQPQGFSTYVPLSDGYILASLPDPIIC